MRKMRNFVLKNAATVTVILGVSLLVLAGALTYQGLLQSRDICSGAEIAGKAKTGGWYPANGTDYVLEARIVGHDAWLNGAINIERGDQVEVRLRIASSNEAYIAGVSRSDISGSSQDAALIEVETSPDSIGNYRSPDARHVTYLPIGIYRIEDTSWFQYLDASLCQLGISHDGGIGGPVYNSISIVPRYSALQISTIIGLIIAGLVALVILTPLSVIGYRRYESEL